jgi:hypothetical protein
MKPGSTTAPAADELETEATETETTETEEGGGDPADAFEDELASAVTSALSDDDEEEDEDELDLDDDDEEDDDEEEDDEEEDDEEGEGTASTETTKADDEPAADATKPAAEAEAPKWEAFAVKADKETFAIEEAQIARSNGNVFLAIPEKQFARFQARISRGVLFERTSRALETERRELEARKNAAPRKSDTEIEAEITLEAIKDHLVDILDEKDLQLLEHKVKLAQKDEAEKYTKAEKERIDKAAETPWEETQVKGLAEVAIDVWGAHPELKDALTEEQLQEVFASELLPVKDALFFKKGDDTLANTQYIYDRLKARATGKAPAGGGKPAPTGSTKGKEKSAPNPAAKANPGKTATPAKGKTIDAADRFNKGVDANARTTSVKANRTARPAKANTRDAKGKTRRRAPESHDVQAQAEDNWRATERKFLSSDSLEFDEA